MATSNPRNILVFLFYTGLTTSFLSFLTLLDTVFHKSLDAAEGGGLSAPQLIPFVNIRGGLPIGALLLTGIVLFLLMHFEVKFLQEGRLLFDADRSQRFYVLATVCILSIIVTVGDLFEVYYEHGIASSRETHTGAQNWSTYGAGFHSNRQPLVTHFGLPAGVQSIDWPPPPERCLPAR